MLVTTLANYFEADDIEPVPNGAMVYGDVNLNDIVPRLVEAGVNITAINTTKSSIEDYYLRVVGGGANA